MSGTMRAAALAAAVALAGTLTPLTVAHAAVGPAPSYFPAAAPMVDVSSTPSGAGYWVLDETGGVFTFGDARYHGSIPQLRHDGQAIPPVNVVALEPTPTGAGYWVLDETGGVFTFGDARYHGSIPQLRHDGQAIPPVNVVALEPTPTGAGYWVLDETGGVFTFGDARYHGSIPQLRHDGGLIGRAPVVGMSATPAGDGYWVADQAGGVFVFGAARFAGSIPGLRSENPTIGRADARDLVASPGGSGYWVLDHAGGVFGFGAVSFHGSAPGRQIGFDPVGVAARPQGDGYWLVDATGTVLAFGAAGAFGAATVPGSGPLPAFPDPDGGYALVPLRDRAPGRWLPCRPIHYVVHADEGAPEGLMPIVKRATAKITEATGIVFAFDGLTDERWSLARPLRDPDRYGDRLSPLLISFEWPNEHNGFDEEGEFMGVAVPDGGLGKIVFGELAINLDGIGFSLADEHDDWDTRVVEMVVMHELGHTMGLAHSASPDQVMTSGADADVDDLFRTEWQPGDLRGLRRVGRAAGCDTRPQATIDDQLDQIAALASARLGDRRPIRDRASHLGLR